MKYAKYGALLMLAAVICPHASIAVILWLVGVGILSFCFAFALAAPPESTDERRR